MFGPLKINNLNSKLNTYLFCSLNGYFFNCSKALSVWFIFEMNIKLIIVIYF